MADIQELIDELENEKRIFNDRWEDVQQTWNDRTQISFKKNVDCYLEDISELLHILQQIQDFKEEE